MNNFAVPAGFVLDRAREAFAEIEQAEGLLRRVPASRPRMSASGLYAAAKAGAELDAGLAGNSSARCFYRLAVAETSAYALPQARAASSGTLPARHGEGCRIRTERSRAEPDQFFVVVELLKDSVRTVPPTSLIVCDSEDRCRRYTLPALRDGIAQILADADSDLMRLIGDPTTRVYLR